MVNVKQAIRQVLPQGMVAQYYRSRIARNRRKNQTKTTAEVFSAIYQSGEWGKSAEQYDSGAGSSEDRFIAPYCTLIQDFVAGLDRDDLTIVDLGCGDFRVGRSVNGLPLDDSKECIKQEALMMTSLQLPVRKPVCAPIFKYI
jgi:hypothetical protein